MVLVVRNQKTDSNTELINIWKEFVLSLMSVIRLLKSK